MPRALSKKSSKRRAKAPAPAGRILEMRPVAENRLRSGLTPGLIVLLLVTIGSIAVAAFAFQKLAVVIGYADATASRLASVQQQAADLKERVDNFETLRLLAQKTVESATLVAPPSDVVWLDYASKNLSLKYPQGFTVVKATSAFPALTIKNDKGQVMIFRVKDFPGGVLPAAISNRVSEGSTNYANLLTVSSTDNAKIAPYNVWMEGPKGDDATEAVLKQIIASVKIIR